MCLRLHRSHRQLLCAWAVLVLILQATCEPQGSIAASPELSPRVYIYPLPPHLAMPALSFMWYGDLLVERVRASGHYEPDPSKVIKQRRVAAQDRYLGPSPCTDTAADVVDAGGLLLDPRRWPIPQHFGHPRPPAPHTHPVSLVEPDRGAGRGKTHLRHECGPGTGRGVWGPLPCGWSGRPRWVNRRDGRRNLPD